MRNFKLTFLFLILHFISFAQIAEIAGLKYRIQIPMDSIKQKPMIILLHGFGSNEADLFSLKNTIPDSFILISVQAPFEMGRNSYRWFSFQYQYGKPIVSQEEIDKSVVLLKAFIPAVVEKYNPDKKHIYLGGFSQGAMMSYEIGLKNPELISGIAAMGGRIFPSTMDSIKTSDALKHLKIFIGHGDADMMIPYKDAEEANKVLKKLGSSPTFKTYINMGHTISKEELKDLVEWLTSY